MNNYAMLESFQTAKGRSGIQHKRSVIGPGFQVSLRSPGMTEREGRTA